MIVVHYSIEHLNYLLVVVESLFVIENSFCFHFIVSAHKDKRLCGERKMFVVFFMTEYMISHRIEI